MDELQKVKEIFLADVDEETYQENIEEITEWEKSLVENENYLSWLEHPVTQQILNQARKTYVDAVVTLGKNVRNLQKNDIDRLTAHQDACLWFISIGSKDVKNQIEMIKGEIERAVNATN